ncbi:MAG TPA: hypothetical protein VMY05_08165 [Acidobacteriota bacterium]|nr:hypothetical protein [Acidobacteriota bacterium]
MTRARYDAHFAADPYYNMAFDEWLLCRALAEPASIFVRLYTWRVGAITFGFNQNERTALDFSRLDGTPVIRRVTGGRAVFHDPSELTYAVAVNREGLAHASLSGSLSQTCRAIAGALQDFLDRVGVVSEYVHVSTPGQGRREFFNKAPCFASAARHELVAAGRKVVASAQRRIGPALLQHGSIKMGGVAVHPALHGPADSPQNPLPLTGREFAAWSEDFAATLAGSLGIDIEPDALSSHDVRQVAARVEYLKKNSCAKRQIVKRL